MRIVLLPEGVNVDLKLILTELFAYVFRKAGADTNQPVAVRKLKRGFFGVNNGAEGFHGDSIEY